MISRTTVDRFIDYFKSKTDNVYFIDKLSEEERRYWSVNKKVVSCKKVSVKL